MKYIENINYIIGLLVSIFYISIGAINLFKRKLIYSNLVLYSVGALLILSIPIKFILDGNIEMIDIITLIVYSILILYILKRQYGRFTVVNMRYDIYVKEFNSENYANLELEKIIRKIGKNSFEINLSTYGKNRILLNDIKNIIKEELRKHRKKYLSFYDSILLIIVGLLLLTFVIYKLTEVMS